MNRKSANSSPLNNSQRCTHTTRNGRCRMPATDSATNFCSEHAPRQDNPQQSLDPETLAAELLGDIEDFTTADSVNFFLGNLVKQLARKRIARRDAIALAYLGQLLLNSLPTLWKEMHDERVAAAYFDDLARRQDALLAEKQSPEPTTVRTNPS
jgi:hypothetical protein